MKTNVYIVLMTTIMYFLSILHCQDVVTSEVGTDTCITFSVSNNVEPLYINRFNDSLCIDVSGKIFTNPSLWNRSFSCNDSTFGLSVCFSDTMASDAGMFYLIVHNTTEYNSTLVVEYPPRVLLLDTRKIIEGESLSITCPYNKGNPSFTTVYWEKEMNSSYMYPGQTLRIPNIDREAAGNYVCIAENTYSNGNNGSTNSTMYLDVQYPPSIQPFIDLTTIEGTIQVITCNITEGNPQNLTKVYWTRSGLGTVQSGQNLTLRFERSLTGTYVCHAQNTYEDGTQGEATQSMKIDVEYPPSVSPMHSTYPKEHSDFSIHCSATPGNPLSFVYYWTLSGDIHFRQNSSTLRLPRISRNDSGTYFCTAVNSYSNGEEGSDSKPLIIDVQYPPVVSSIDDIQPVEHTSVNVPCIVKPGNPNTTSVYWTKSGYSGVWGTGTTLVLNYISKSDSGTYSCIAENTYHSGGKGLDQQSFVIDVLYGPTLASGQTLTVNEGQRATLSVSITGNPPSNVSWYRGDNLLMSQESVRGITSYTIAWAQCNDIGVYQVTASNGIQSNHSTTVSLYVNCSPRLTTAGTSVTFYVSNNRYLQGEIWVLSYPQPNFTLVLPNGAPNRQIITSIYTMSFNQHRLTLSMSSLKPEDYGRYVLDISNNYGRKTVSVSIIPQNKPYPPVQVLVHCGHGEAWVTWQSSYFGYEHQFSIVQFSTDDVNFVNGTHVTTEKIKQGIYQTTVYNLQDNTNYFLRVFTTNTYGFSMSSVKNCSIEGSEDGPSDSSTVLVGSILGTLLVLALGAVVLLSYKYFTSARKPRDSMLPKDNTEECTGLDNHLYEPLNSENKGVMKTSMGKFKSQDLKPPINSEGEKENARYMPFSASNPVQLALLKPSKTKKAERMYENIDVKAQTCGSASEKKDSGKVKPQILPKPKKSAL